MARINAYLVTGGWWHDFDFARLELLKLLAQDDRVRVQVAQNYDDIEAIAACDFLVSYTCNVRPSADVQQRLRAWVEAVSADDSIGQPSLARDGSAR